MAHDALKIARVVDVELQTHGHGSSDRIPWGLQAQLLSLLPGDLGVVAIEDGVRAAEIPGLDLLLALLATLAQIVPRESVAQLLNRFGVPDFAHGVLGIDAQDVAPIEAARRHDPQLREVQIDRRCRARGTPQWEALGAVEFRDQIGSQHGSPSCRGLRLLTPNARKSRLATTPPVLWQGRHTSKLEAGRRRSCVGHGEPRQERKYVHLAARRAGCENCAQPWLFPSLHRATEAQESCR